MFVIYTYVYWSASIPMILLDYIKTDIFEKDYKEKLISILTILQATATYIGIYFSINNLALRLM